VKTQTVANLCDAFALANTLAMGANQTTGAQRVDICSGTASHLSPNSAAANPPPAAVRLSCNERLRPDQAKATALIVEKRLNRQPFQRQAR
jgi:hypothetical protein